MITIFSGTNRPDSNTAKVARHYANVLRSKNKVVKLFELTNLPTSIAFTEMFGKRSPDFEAIISEYVQPSSKFIFVFPEYNGSFPGILKTFIDAIHPDFYKNKKAALVGVASGRGGNIRGIEHFTGVLHYLKMDVYYDKLPLSKIRDVIDVNGVIVDEISLNTINNQIEGFLNY
ncbi:MAG: NAD(P)H-dependent oxidoreductase [Bacteroidetes bacterium]|nr:NAD(P)H-dependent oxidoreductase [Bacteroidota bacterium]